MKNQAREFSMKRTETASSNAPFRALADHPINAILTQRNQEEGKSAGEEGFEVGEAGRQHRGRSAAVTSQNEMSSSEKSYSMKSCASSSRRC